MNNRWWSRVNDFVKENGSLIILFLGLVIYVFLLYMCITQIKQSNNVSTRNIPPNIPQELIISFQVSDTSALVDPKVCAKWDSVIAVMEEWNIYREENLSQGLDDLRQETNNVINKQNAWLSFWIGILAIVGALIPLLFQLKAQQNIDSEIKRIENQRIAIENLRLSSEISKLSFTLIAIIDNTLSINGIDRNRIINDVLDNLCGSTRKFFDYIRRNELRDIDNDRICLRNVLLQLLAAYNSGILLLSYRRWANLTNDIRTVLSNLYDNSYTQNQEELFSALDRVQEQMDEFRI